MLRAKPQTNYIPTQPSTEVGYHVIGLFLHTFVRYAFLALQFGRGRKKNAQQKAICSDCLERERASMSNNLEEKEMFAKTATRLMLQNGFFFFFIAIKMIQKLVSQFRLTQGKLLCHLFRRSKLWGNCHISHINIRVMTFKWDTSFRI